MIACCKVDLHSCIWHLHFTLLVCGTGRFNVKLLKNFLVVEMIPSGASKNPTELSNTVLEGKCWKTTCFILFSPPSAGPLYSCSTEQQLILLPTHFAFLLKGLKRQFCTHSCPVFALKLPTKVAGELIYQVENLSVKKWSLGWACLT